MSVGFDQVYVATGRLLRGVAESLIAGPFWRAPFGAPDPLNPAPDVDALTSRMADFFERGRRELRHDHR